MQFAGFVRRWWPSMLTLAVILYATLYPDPAWPDNAPVIPHLDKIIHAVMFGGFAGALAFDYARKKPRRRPGLLVMLWCCLVSLALGGIIEVLQTAMGLGRSAEGLDMLADAVGVAVAFVSAPAAVAAVLRIR